MTADGRVFRHPIENSSVGTPIGIPPVSGTIPVAARSLDKWLLTHGNDLLVVTEDGHVFAHLVDGFVHAARELGGVDGVAPRVGANHGDRWVLVVGDQILVITDKGKVFGHRLEGDIIHVPVELTRVEQNVTGGDRDRWVLGMGNDIVIVTGDGRVVTYAVTTSFIAGPNFIQGPQRIAANPEDRWLLGVGSLDRGGKLLVLPYYVSGWRYFAGIGQSARPQWSNEERLAQPLPQLGVPPDGSNIEPANYHTTSASATSPCATSRPPAGGRCSTRAATTTSTTVRAARTTAASFCGPRRSRGALVAARADFRSGHRLLPVHAFARWPLRLGHQPIRGREAKELQGRARPRARRGICPVSSSFSFMAWVTITTTVTRTHRPTPRKAA